MDHRAFLFLFVFPFFPTCTRGKINFSYFQICTRIRRNGRRRMAPFCLWRALWKVCSEWKMCLHSTILFSWKNTRFRSTRRTRKHGNWRQRLFLLLMIIVFFFLFLHSFYSRYLSIPLRVFPSLIYLFPSSFFCSARNKILRAPQRFFAFNRVDLFNDQTFQTN